METKYLKVKDLIEILKAQDPEKEVYLSSDPEGNMFRAVTERCLGEGYFDEDGEEIDHEEEGLEPNAIIIFPG